MYPHNATIIPHNYLVEIGEKYKVHSVNELEGMSNAEAEKSGAAGVEVRKAGEVLGDFAGCTCQLSLQCLSFVWHKPGLN